jgi:hypothetical protein
VRRDETVGKKWKETRKGKVEHLKGLENERKGREKANGLENMKLNYNKRKCRRKERWRN